MNAVQFEKCRAELNAACEQLLLTKGADYTSNKDRMSNFKEVAAFIGVSPMQVWAVYMLKHLFAVMSYIRKGQTASEPVETRFQDLRNYIDLGYGLDQEEKREIAPLVDAVERGLEARRQHERETGYAKLG